jgi:hypothetical protein
MSESDNRTVVKVLEVVQIKGRILVAAQRISGNDVDMGMILTDETGRKWLVNGLMFTPSAGVIQGKTGFGVQALESESELQPGMTLVSEIKG